MENNIINNKQHIFITGTDTDVGKTYVTRLIASFLSKTTKIALYKPIASGCAQENNPLTNEDVATFAAFDQTVPVNFINIWSYAPAIAPHIAAQQVQEPLSIEKFEQHMFKLSQERAEKFPYNLGLIEGAGGWALPLNEAQTLDMWVAKNKLPVILVVGMKLGCLNHALLTAAAIKNSGAELLGWVANVQKPMSYLEENLATLNALMPAPCIDVVKPSQPALSENNTLESRLELLFSH